jgi:hypothetical protein
VSIGILCFLLVFPFIPYRHRYHSRQPYRWPTNWDTYWENFPLIPIGRYVVLLLLVGLVLYILVLPWLDIQHGKKYVGRFQIIVKKTWLGWHWIKIATPQSKCTVVPGYFYRSIQPEDVIQITRTLLSTRRTFSRISNKPIGTVKFDTN